jgi:hypothetical protein
MMSTGIQTILDRDLYQSYLNRLDARALLEHYDARNCSEQTNLKDGSTEIVHSCLLDRVYPHHTNGDENPSASCNLDSKKYVCYSLGMGCDLFHLVMKLEGRESLGDSMGVVAQFLTGATISAQKFREELEKKFSKVNAYTINLPSQDPKILRTFDHRHDYWASRGVSTQAQDALQLGFDPRTGRIVFPHFVKGELVGWQKRVVPGVTTEDLDAKYKNSPGFPKSETVYNLDRARKYESTVVVESPMSVAVAMSHGIPNVVSTFGAKIGPHQIEELASFSTVYVWMDRDIAGIQAEQKLVEGLYRHTRVKVVAPDWGKDMADCDHDQILSKLIEATPAALRLGKYRKKRWL